MQAPGLLRPTSPALTRSDRMAQIDFISPTSRAAAVQRGACAVGVPQESIYIVAIRSLKTPCRCCCKYRRRRSKNVNSKTSPWHIAKRSVPDGEYNLRSAACAAPKDNGGRSHSDARMAAFFPRRRPLIKTSADTATRPSKTHSAAPAAAARSGCLHNAIRLYRLD